jgi:hypothetical protein
MSYEEWLEIRMAFLKELGHLKTLNEFQFWRYPSVGRLSERMRDYLEKTKELEKECPW